MGQVARIPAHKRTTPKLKPHYGTRLNRGLKLAFVLSLIVFFVSYNFSDKNDCDVCKFPFGNEVLSHTEAMDLYREGCLDNYYNKTDIYVNLDNITINKTSTGLNEITFPLEAIQNSP
jgi:hypothetical protein